jgi:hypothetical protein
MPFRTDRYRVPDENFVVVAVEFLGCFQTDSLDQIVECLNHGGISTRSAQWKLATRALPLVISIYYLSKWANTMPTLRARHALRHSAPSVSGLSCCSTLARR